MCTAISINSLGHLFGRNLDLEYGYHETVTVTPRAYPFRFRRVQPMEQHYAMIGMASVVEGFPLYYEATNEYGLSMAGLNFPKSATYHPEKQGMDNICPFELIPWILGQCRDISQAQVLLGRMNLLNQSFSEELPLSPLHWMISDKSRSLVVEPMADGIHIYENPVGVMTNEPPFDYHLYNLSNYLNLTAEAAVNRSAMQVTAFSNGMGSIGLPGDYSSSSRFVRAAFVRANSVCTGSEVESISEFFHILGAVSMPTGCVDMGHGRYEITRYSCCCTAEGVYYYTTYHNSSIHAVDMRLEDLEGDAPVSYPLQVRPQFIIQNPKGQ